MGDVPTKAVLDWLGECLRHHSNESEHRGSSALLIPTALSERERWASLIREVVLQEDGVLVDATSLGETGARCGDLQGDAPEMVSAVEQLLAEYNARDVDAQLTLVFAGDRVRVDGAQDFSAVNAAQRALREVATALCADELRSTTFVTLMYAEDALDETNASAVWSLVLRAPELLRLTAASTLVVVAGDGILRFNLHCTGERSVRFRLDGRGKEDRRPWNQNRSMIQKLARHGRSEMPLLPIFLGAGASVAASLPTGDALRNKALASITQSPVDSGTWRDVAGKWFRDLEAEGRISPEEAAIGLDQFVGGLTLERVLEVEQDDEGQAFSTTLRYFDKLHTAAIGDILRRKSLGELDNDPMVRLIGAQKRMVLLTVNFDHVIESKAGGGVKPFFTEAHFAELPAYLDSFAAHGGALPLIKLHGDISEPNTLVANMAMTRAGLSGARNAALEEVVKRVASQEQRPWWYIGYSMRDADLVNMWSNPSFADHVTENWVAPFLDPAVREFVARHRLLRWRGTAGRDKFTAEERLISLTADDAYRLLFDEVVKHW